MTSRYIKYVLVNTSKSNVQFHKWCKSVQLSAHTWALYENEFIHLNRKHIHSINVQDICDPDMVLINVVAQCPGSTHDSFILEHSRAGSRLQVGAVCDGWLLGKVIM